jgi:hypothetical protein
VFLERIGADLRNAVRATVEELDEDGDDLRAT